MSGQCAVRVGDLDCTSTDERGHDIFPRGSTLNFYSMLVDMRVLLLSTSVDSVCFNLIGIQRETERLI